MTANIPVISGNVIKEFWNYREMLILLAWRDVKVRYAQSALGFGWALFPPISQMVIYSVVFGSMVRIDSDGAPYPLFALCAVIPWMFFSQSFNAVSSSIYGAGSFLQKIYFPRIVLPVAALLEKSVDFFVAFVVLLAIILLFGGKPNINVLALPLLILILAATTLGYGMFVAAVAVHFRDLMHMMGYVTTVLMYASPVVYPISLVPERYRLYYSLNPMVGVIEGFRSALLSTRPMPWDLIAISGSVALFGLLLGFTFFRVNEPKFADIV